MGHFSNSTEGESYQDEWCFRCIHFGTGSDEPGDKPVCPVWGIHLDLFHSAVVRGDCGPEAAKAVRSVLDEFIPRDEQGMNQRCLVFTDKREGPDLPGQERLFEDVL